MGQCKKTLTDGEQCSNRAVPDTDYCKAHKRRIKFRRITRKTPCEATPEQEPATYHAIPTAYGKTPAFPGVRADKRNTLVGPEGIIRLSAGETDDRDDTLFDRLAGVLAHISRKSPLAGHVKVLNTAEPSELRYLKN